MCSNNPEVNLTQQTECLKDGVVWNKNSYYLDNYSFFLQSFIYQGLKLQGFLNNGYKKERNYFSLFNLFLYYFVFLGFAGAFALGADFLVTFFFVSCTAFLISVSTSL